MNERIPIILKADGDRAYAEALAAHLKTTLLDATPEASIWLSVDATGLSLTDGDQAMRGDFTKLQKRFQYHNLTHELLVKATKVKGREKLRVIDATAGMGEDSLLLAASGCEVTLYEQDPVIAALLKDTMRRALEEAALHEIVMRMQLVEGDKLAARMRAQVGQEFRTQSPRGIKLLYQFNTLKKLFVKVIPRDYERVINAVEI